MGYSVLELPFFFNICCYSQWPPVACRCTSCSANVLVPRVSGSCALLHVLKYRNLALIRPLNSSTRAAFPLPTFPFSCHTFVFLSMNLLRSAVYFASFESLSLALYVSGSPIYDSTFFKRKFNFMCLLIFFTTFLT